MATKKKATKSETREDEYPDLKFAIKKSDKGRIKVSVQRYGEDDYLDIRHMFLAKDGKWAPTRKGCAVPLNLAQKLHRRLGKLLKAAEGEGLQIAEE